MGCLDASVRILSAGDGAGSQSNGAAELRFTIHIVTGDRRIASAPSDGYGVGIGRGKPAAQPSTSGQKRYRQNGKQKDGSQVGHGLVGFFHILKRNPQEAGQRALPFPSIREKLSLVEAGGIEPPSVRCERTILPLN